MSQPKTTEEKLKEAVEASKITLALSEQVNALALEKETLTKRLADVEKAISSPRAEATSMGDEVKALLETQATKIAELYAKVEASLFEAQAAKAGKTKADLKEYVKQKNEEGEEGNTPAEKINNSGKKGKDDFVFVPVKQEWGSKDEEEACGPMKGKGSKATDPEEPEQLPPIPEEIHIKMKGKKGAKAWDEDKTPEPLPVENHDAEDCEDDKKSKKASKASKKAYEDFGDLSDEEVMMIKQYRQQEEGDYAKSEKSKKADSELSSPTVEDSKNFKKELPQGGLDPEKNNVNEDNTTSPKMAKKAKMKGEQKETDVEEIMESPDMQNEEGEEGHTHENTLSKPEKGAKKAENDLGGINKQEVVRTKEECEEEGEGSFLNKKDGKKGKRAEDAVQDTVIEEAVQKLAAIAQAKVKAEQENVSMREMLAFETKAKTEAMASVEALHKKFEALMGKVNQIEASDRSLETKAAKIVSAQGVEPLASAPENEVKAKTDADFLAEFEAIKDAREKNKFFNANRPAIERAAFVNMKRRS
jgi:hypothetical protein